MAKQQSEIRYDRYGPIRQIGNEAEGYVMVRRPRAMTYAITVREWDKFSHEPVESKDLGPTLRAGMVFA
jgi:hypothetical protein